jgi:3-oxoacyl-[acyl-carrier protein] reductase
MDSGLGQKVVVVTGGAAGIGRATAVRFAEEGSRLALWDVNDAAAPAALDEIRRIGGEALFSKVNVARAEEVARALDEVVGRWGRVDVLINNAGILRDAQLVKWKDGRVAAAMTGEEFDAVIDVNLRGVFHCTRAVVPLMIAQGGGVILNAASVVGLYGNFGQTNYAATKAAVINMTRTWSRELGRYGIRVNAVAPGMIATEILQAMPPKVLEGLVAHTPIGRIGDPRDVAEAYVWLASDRASFVHGATLSVDGGLVVGT